MPVVPSATNMKFKFPEFNTLDDATVEFAVEEANVAAGGYGAWIDDSNQTLAIMYYAAHLLMVSIQRAQSGGAGIVTSQKTPELAVSFAVPPQPSYDKPYDLSTTFYGVRFLGLVSKNFPAILTVGSAVAM